MSPRVESIPALEGVRVATVELVLPDLAELTDQERTLYDRLPEGPRRIEWFSARLAAHAALAALGARRLSVLKDEQRAPRLEGPGAGDFEIALSHGRHLAAAIATLTRGPWPHVGVDVLDADDIPRIERVGARFLRPAEVERARGDPRSLLLAWGAREAIAKATRTGMFVFALSGVWVEDVDRATGRAVTNLEGVEVVFRDEGERGALVIAAAGSEAVARARERTRFDSRL